MPTLAEKRKSTDEPEEEDVDDKIDLNSAIDTLLLKWDVDHAEIGQNYYNEGDWGVDELVEKFQTDLSDEDTDDRELVLLSRSADEKQLPPSKQVLLDAKDITQASNIGYFYLKKEVGLSDADMLRISCEAGTVLGQTAQTLRRKVNLLSRSMDLDDEEIRTMLRKQPHILTLSADKNLAYKILFLQRTLDLSKEDLRSIVMLYPSILKNSITTLRRKVSLFMKLIGFNKDDCRKLFVAEPRLLTCGIQGGLFPRMKYIISELELTTDDFRTMIRKNPGIMLSSVKDNLHPKITNFLRKRLQMSKVQARSVLLRFPHLLNYNLNNYILPIVEYLIKQLEFKPQDIRSAVLRFPKFLSYSLSKVKHVVGFLNYELGMDVVQVKSVILKSPQVVSLDTELNVKVKVEYLRKELRLDGDELRRVVSCTPSLLNLKRDKLHKKISVLREALHDEEDLRREIVRFPTLLAYSLENRICPRIKAILARGQRPILLNAVLPLKDKDFVALLDKRSKIEQFKEGAQIKDEEQQAPIAEDRSKRRILHWKR